MKKLMVLLLLASMVTANEGYMPITIFEGGKYAYAYCKIGEPCKYLNGQPLGETASPIAKKNMRNVPYVLAGGIMMAITLAVATAYKVAIWGSPKH